MKKPKMILFDYGQTLLDERPFLPVNGNAEVLKYAISNRHSLSPEQVQIHANEISAELSERSFEYTCVSFNRYLYPSLGIELSISPEEAEWVFWNGSTRPVPTDGIAAFLEYLHQNGIRTGVISNITFSGAALKRRIDAQLPGHHFEFILASSDILFRKPNPRIFRLALEMAQLNPEDCWYIGDNPDFDVTGAQSVGMLPVWYTGALTISDWKKLTALLSSCQE